MRVSAKSEVGRGAGAAARQGTERPARGDRQAQPRHPARGQGLFAGAALSAGAACGEGDLRRGGGDPRRSAGRADRGAARQGGVRDQAFRFHQGDRRQGTDDSMRRSSVGVRSSSATTSPTKPCSRSCPSCTVLRSRSGVAPKASPGISTRRAMCAAGWRAGSQRRSLSSGSRQELSESMNYGAHSLNCRVNAAAVPHFFNTSPDWRPIGAVMRREVPGTILMNSCLSSDLSCARKVSRKAGRGPL